MLSPVGLCPGSSYFSTLISGLFRTARDDALVPLWRARSRGAPLRTRLYRFCSFFPCFFLFCFRLRYLTARRTRDRKVFSSQHLFTDGVCSTKRRDFQVQFICLALMHLLLVFLACRYIWSLDIPLVVSHNYPCTILGSQETKK